MSSELGKKRFITDKTTCSGWLRSEIWQPRMCFKSSQLHFTHYNQNWPFKPHSHSSGNIYVVLISEKAIIFNVSQITSGQPLARGFYAKFTCYSIFLECKKNPKHLFTELHAFSLNWIPCLHDQWYLWL